MPRSKHIITEKTSLMADPKTIREVFYHSAFLFFIYTHNNISTPIPEKAGIPMQTFHKTRPDYDYLFRFYFQIALRIKS